MKRIIYVIIFIIILASGLYIFRDRVIPFFYQPTTSTMVKEGWVVENGLTDYNGNGSVIAVNLQVPWEIVFLPDGDALVTERPGTLTRIGNSKKSIRIPDVYATGEGGLLGMALEPSFANNRYLYLYLTTQKDGKTQNEIHRYVYTANGELQDQTKILTGIPGARTHNGGRIKFGPDGYLYVATGDAAVPTLAQNKKSLAGKILRITRDGKPAPGNPFDNEVYSYGHRNPQGLAWDDQNRLWSTEHGPTGNDELNHVTAGTNYGWPVIEGGELLQDVEGGEMAADIESPVIYSGKHQTWAPTGLAYLDGRLFFGGLRGQSLYEAKIDSESARVTEIIGHYSMEFGRIRNIVATPDGYLYLMTSNRDGRGRPKADDDKIVRMPPPLYIRHIHLDRAPGKRGIQ